MNVRFLLGPAGSGKTFRCLEAIRAELLKDPLGDPLILLAPRQATYQLELQLLSDPALTGYTRLQIVSFERFALWLLGQIGEPPPRMLSEDGRIMVLRALLEKHHGELRTFGASGRSSGFAKMLSEQLREMQQYRVSVSLLRETAERLTHHEPTRDKLLDLAFLLERYHAWLTERELPDAGTLLDHVVSRLARGEVSAGFPAPIHGLWLDGIAELTPQEMELLVALSPICREATLAFCLESEPNEEPHWLSNWSVIGQTFRKMHARMAAAPGCDTTVERIERAQQPSRFSLGESSGRTDGGAADEQLDLFRAGPSGSLSGPRGRVLAHLESAWTSGVPSTLSSETIETELSLRCCLTGEQEAVMAAREILRFVRAGNRFRECAVLLRDLDTHAAGLRRVFTRYEIPFFMDQRESAAHHPMAELTRSALHMVLFNWRLNDWFGALKTGLTDLDAEEVDRLENAALANGWEGGAWFKPLSVPDDPQAARAFERMRRRIIAPFQSFREALTGAVGGGGMASAIRGLWEALDVEGRLNAWTTESEEQASVDGAAHLTVLEEMQSWLENLELAFADHVMSLDEWLPILETGLSSLTVGVIPPVIDQVLIGAVDRSRNPDLKLALVLGLNEGVFPRSVADTSLLTEFDREHLEGTAIHLRGTQRALLGHERYLGYIAFTRARERVVLSWSEQNVSGTVLNRSPLIDRICQLLPQARVREDEGAVDFDACVHPSEVLTPMLQHRMAGEVGIVDWVAGEVPAASRWVRHFEQFENRRRQQRLSPEVIRSLHGRRLKASASRLEQFAACPFQYFVSAGLRAKERLRFEVDARKTGTFMHEVLRQFHEELEGESRPWRSLTPADARDRIARIAEEQRGLFAGGVLAAGARNVFRVDTLIRLLQAFVARVIEWMRSYRFDPVAVELSIGGEGGRLPWWVLPLGDDQELAFRGSVDRVDAATVSPDDDFVLLNVIDYKSGQMKFEADKMQAGLQLQLPAYLAALCAVAPESGMLNGRRPRPAGMFYVRLKDSDTRSETRDGGGSSRSEKPFRHTGRFSFDFLALFDDPDAVDVSGPFTYRLRKDGTPTKNSPDLVSQAELERLVSGAEAMLQIMGRRIMDGDIAVDPYRKGSETACDRCDYRSICRIDPWTHAYRPLRPLIGQPVKGS